MDYRPLGDTGITVSAVCLGTMTWGSQNSEAEGHAQIDLALTRGINFLDTAEMYPVTPTRVETFGRTEEIIGWPPPAAASRLSSPARSRGHPISCRFAAAPTASTAPISRPRCTTACAVCAPITSISISCTGPIAPRPNSASAGCSGWMMTPRR